MNNEGHPAYASYAVSRLVPRLLAWLEWLDLRILRCRWRWFCMAIQLPAWLAAQAEIESQVSITNLIDT